MMTEQGNLNDRLSESAESGDLAALAQALEDGADAKANSSWALHRAAAAGHLECVRVLIPVSDPLASESRTLVWAALNGQAKCVALLLPVSDPVAIDPQGLNVAASARERGYADVAGIIEAFIESQALSLVLEENGLRPRVTKVL